MTFRRAALAFALTGSLFLTGCQSLLRPQDEILSPEAKAAQRAELETAWKSLNEERFQDALSAFQLFQKQHPQSIFASESQLGEAQAWAGLNEWTKAGAIDRAIILERISSHPDIAAMAMFDLSAVSEALGEESQMLANLQDAETHAADLPAEIRLAALPARLAVAYLKVSQPKEAEAARARAEKGIAQLKALNLPLGKWAELNYLMGSVSTNQLSTENFQAHLDSFAGAQIFLLKAVETGVEPWSLRALKSLQEHYRDFWNLAMNPPVSSGLDRGAQERMRAELQARWLGEIAKLMTLLKQNYKPEELKLSPDEKKLRQLIENLAAETERHQLEAASVLPLTPEARRRQSLRKGGTLRSVPLFPNEKKTIKTATPAPAVPAQEDPNLKSGDGR